MTIQEAAHIDCVCFQEVDTVLVKLLAEENSSSLPRYMENYDLFLEFDEAKEAFERYQVT